MRLIDADEVMSSCIRIVGSFDLSGGKKQDFESIPVQQIENAPTVDAVAVVRCKDCKHYDRKNGRHCAEFNTDMGGNDFCSYGTIRNKESDAQ